MFRLLIIPFLILTFAAQAGTPVAYHKIMLLMATRTEFTAVSEDSVLAKVAIDAAAQEFNRIDSLISEWKSYSQTSEINRNAGIKPVVVDQELYELISRSIRISKLTNGAFDISFAAIDKVWKFDGSLKKMPAASEIAASVSKIGYEKIVLDSEKHSVFLKEKGMKIGFGGIGQGYAVVRATKIMQEMGIKSGVVNASGDIYAWGQQPDGKPWYVGIGDPVEKDKVFSWLSASEIAIVTSGNYEKFVMFNGTRYAHIIDPRTGWPSSELKSVTIICPNAELADALSTGIFVLGPKEGLNLINQLKGIECIMITDKDEIVTSDNLKLHFYKNQNYEKELQSSK